MRLRARKTSCRKGRPRERPPRRSRVHTIISSRQTARETDMQTSITSDCDFDAPIAQLTSDIDQALRRLTHAMVYAGIEYLDIVVELAGSAVALVSWLRTSLPLFHLDLRNFRCV